MALYNFLNYKSTVKSKLEYCSTLWSPHKVQYNITLEALQRFFTSRIWGCEDRNYIHCETLEHFDLQSPQRRHKRYIMMNTKNCPAVRSLYENSFPVEAAKLWNMLPASIKTLIYHRIFKAAFEKFLDKFPDKSPTSGYTTQFSNFTILAYSVGWSTCSTKVLILYAEPYK